MPQAPAQEAPKAVGAAKVMATRPQTVSINPNKVMQQAKPETTVDKVEDKPTEQDQPFTPEQLKEALKFYVESLTPAKKHNLLVIWKEHKHQIDGNIIRITVTNRVQATLLEQEKPDMLDMVRGRIKNRQVALEVVVELPPEAPVAKMLTNNERFEMMAEKNPVLREMKQIFDLDTETPH